MLRSILLAAALVPLLFPAPATAQDITGTWRIASSQTFDGGSYGGSVTIRKNGDCYSVDWLLDTGDTYSGVGLVARGLTLAVAYRAGPADGYGVVFYAYNEEKGAFEGWWCQPDGKSGVENLSGNTLTGTHTLTAGSSTGTIQISPYGPANYQLAWRTSSGNYNGFATSLGEKSGMMAGVWGNLEGTGVVLYSLVELENGKMPGWWAASVSEGQGRETLTR